MTSTGDPSVKAVGFAYTSPEVIILFSQHQDYKLSIYPPKKGVQFSLPETELPNIVLLRAVEQLPSLAPWAGKIHRLIIFGNYKALLEHNLPLLDAVKSDDGKITPQARQSVDKVLKRIEDEAIDLPLIYQHASKSKDQTVQEKKKMSSGKTFIGLMRGIRDKVSKSDDLNFVEDVGVPAVNRLFGDIDRSQFVSACKLLVTHGGLREDLARTFYRWVEGYDGEGPDLAKAAEAYLYPPDGDDAPDLSDLAEEHGVSEDDIQFLCATYEKIHGLDDEEGEEEESEDSVDDGWDTESEESDDGEEEGGEEEGGEEEDGEEESESSDFGDFGEGAIFDESEEEEDNSSDPFDEDSSESDDSEGDPIADGFSDVPDFGEFGEESDDSKSGSNGFDADFDDF